MQLGMKVMSLLNNRITFLVGSKEYGIGFPIVNSRTSGSGKTHALSLLSKSLTTRIAELGSTTFQSFVDEFGFRYDVEKPKNMKEEDWQQSRQEVEYNSLEKAKGIKPFHSIFFA